MILESGVALFAQTGTDANKTSFSFIAHKMGCASNSTPAEEVACMRKVDAGAIENFLQKYTDSGATRGLYFSASADGKVVFLPQQYVAKGKAGDFANVVRACYKSTNQSLLTNQPMLLGSNTEEGSSFVPFTINGTGVTPALVEALTLKVVQCSVATTSRYD